MLLCVVIIHVIIFISSSEYVYSPCHAPGRRQLYRPGDIHVFRIYVHVYMGIPPQFVY